MITGQHTHICVRHSSYGALIRGYAITTPRDAVCGFEGVDEDEALAYLEMAYGAKTTTVDELVDAPAAGHVYELAATRSAVAVWRERDDDFQGRWAPAANVF